MRKTAAVIVCFCLAVAALAQGQAGKTSQEASASSDLLKQFTRSAKIDGVVLNFVLLNNKTIELLFQGPSKYAMHARANQFTTFYVMGAPEKDVTLDTKFVVEQDGETINGSSLNIKNFETGNVAKGERINGIFQLEKKIDITHAFKIKGAHSTLEFKLSHAALKEMAN